jgi:hypothetical protein
MELFANYSTNGRKRNIFYDNDWGQDFIPSNDGEFDINKFFF